MCVCVCSIYLVSSEVKAGIKAAEEKQLSTCVCRWVNRSCCHEWKAVCGLLFRIEFQVLLALLILPQKAKQTINTPLHRGFSRVWWIESIMLQSTPDICLYHLRWPAAFEALSEGRSIFRLRGIVSRLVSSQLITDLLRCRLAGCSFVPQHACLLPGSSHGHASQTCQSTRLLGHVYRSMAWGAD